MAGGSKAPSAANAVSKKAGGFGPLIWALDQEQDLSASTKLLLVMVCRHSGAEGANSFPSVARLVNDTLLTRRTVQSGLRALEEAGYVVAVQGGGRNRTSRYRLPRFEAFLAGKGATIAPFTDDETAQPLRPLAPETDAERAQSMPERAQSTTRKGATIAPKLLLTSKATSIGRARTSAKPARTQAEQASRRARIEPDWQPDQAGIDHAQQAGVGDVDGELAKFRDHHTARGNLMADWPAAWRTWCRNAQRFAGSKPSPQRSVDPVATRADDNPTANRMPSLSDPLEAWHWLGDRDSGGAVKIETGVHSESALASYRKLGKEPEPIDPVLIGMVCAGGFYLPIVARDLAQAARIYDPDWRPDWRPLCAWLRQGIRSSTIVEAVRRVASRPNYTAPKPLAYFDGAVREAFTRQSKY